MQVCVNPFHCVLCMTARLSSDPARREWQGNAKIDTLDPGVRFHIIGGGVERREFRGKKSKYVCCDTSGQVHRTVAIIR